MKKYIISFSFRGFNFSAKVHIRKSERTVIYSIASVDGCDQYELHSHSLIFLEYRQTIQLVLLEETGEIHLVNWRIRSKYISTDVVRAEESFSLS